MADLVFGVSPQVREEACEAGWAKTQPYGPTLSRTEVGDVVDAAIPVIAQAAYKAGLEEAKARIRAAINEIDWDRGLPELVVSQEQEDAFRTFRRAALAAIDKEGEGS